MAVAMRKTVHFIFLIFVLTIVIWVFAWSMSVYKNDTSGAIRIRMNAQEQCFLNELKKTDTVTDKCLKDGFGAIITIKDENNEIKHKFGPDVTSLVDFCFIPKKNFLCVRRSSFVNNKEVEIGIVPQ